MRTNQKADSTTVIEGDLERITYYNQQTHYTIARLKTSAAARPLTIVGFLGGIQPGETLKISGCWETHPKYGQQFRVKTYEVTLPATIQGIRKYFKSGIIKGLGPQLADRLVDHFGDKTLQIIEHHSDRLQEIDGIGKSKASLIMDAWNEHHIMRGLVRFLQDMGIKTTYGAKVFHTYGDLSLKVLQESPYRLAEDIPEFGFQMADTIARKMGTPDDDPVRVRACILNGLEKYAGEGHTFAFKNHLIIRCEHLFKLYQDAVLKGIKCLSDSGELIIEKVPFDTEEIDDFENIDDNAVYRKSLYKAESGIAARIAALFSVPFKPEKIDIDFIHSQVTDQLSIKLSSEQLDVINDLFMQKAAIITGGPGTGKTTLIRSIAAIFKAMNKRVLLGAPTGRAAKRLSEVSREKAVTIHRLLGFTFSQGSSEESFFGRDQDNPLEADVIIIDEASMVDTPLMYHLLNAISPSSRLVLVGDVFQLPSVGPGNVLSDMIHSQAIQVYYLNTIFRQSRQSQIIVNAHKVRNGEVPELHPFEENEQPTDFYFLNEEGPANIAETIVSLCAQVLPSRFSFNPISDIQVLTPMHKGDAGTINLNLLLQKEINKSSIQMESLGNSFKLGDKVMHLKNNYQKEVFNGDIGVICSMDLQKKRLSVDYEGRVVNYDYAETDELTLAYAISVHKSQGSEYPVVILPLLTQHYMLLQRNVLYTAITRGKKVVIIVGTQKALNIALSNDKPQKRLSGLSFRITQCMKNFLL
ncbi:MAG: ATP-dependent RecD-like DNA helicase [Desulfobacterales bacterium]|nr:ATP-dependent RecD-like DNA helicase [Desulfobacterales bacterium]